MGAECELIFPTVPTIQQRCAWVVAQGLSRLEMQMLTLYALGQGPQNRAWLLAHDTDAMPAPIWSTLQSCVRRRLQGEPMAYITGTKEFYGLPLQVDTRVLDPRDDTETLVDWALDLGDGDAHQRVVDLGTGSGAIALALQHRRPHWQVTAVDVSADALAVAQANARSLGLGVAFVRGNWLAALQGLFDLIVSNPPYIAAADPHLEALCHEPLSALASGSDGLDDIRTIIGQAPSRLCSGGWLLLEHGYDQAAAVRALLTAAGLQDVQSRRDLAGIERCSGGCWSLFLPGAKGLNAIQPSSPVEYG
jgi:release factor glutamine methyltransferase